MTPLPTLEELRARVGEAGADLTDEQLLRAHGQARLVASALVGCYRDRLDPAGAARREQQALAALEQLKAPRRRKYAREKARAQVRRSA